MQIHRGLFVVGAFIFATGCDVDHTGLLTEMHDFEVSDDTVRVELRNFDEAVVRSTGERGTNQGELHSFKVTLSAPLEFSSLLYTTTDTDIRNDTRSTNGGTGYVDIDVDDQLSFYSGVLEDDDGVRLRKPSPWVNVRPGARIEIRVDTRELDCTGQNVCNRDDTGSVSYEMTIPIFLESLPTTCQEDNSLIGSSVDDEYRFLGTLDYERTESGEPIIVPSFTENDAILCFLPAR